MTNENKDDNGIRIKKTEKYPNGEYKGEFKEDIREGYGIYTWKNGSKYEGYFKDNKFDGKGIFIWR